MLQFQMCCLRFHIPQAYLQKKRFEADELCKIRKQYFQNQAYQYLPLLIYFLHF
ncbi:hypothetical protein EVA_11109 [gut metagenome]|uniref:Uncharacterized protein n=1 Tax=gut metagenome TaxID=749906 RepID=J9G1R0_9ZZZZ